MWSPPESSGVHLECMWSPPETSGVHLECMWSPPESSGVHLECMWSPPESSGVHLESIRNLQSAGVDPQLGGKKFAFRRIRTSDLPDIVNVAILTVEPFNHTQVSQLELQDTHGRRLPKRMWLGARSILPPLSSHHNHHQHQRQRRQRPPCQRHHHDNAATTSTTTTTTGPLAPTEAATARDDDDASNIQDCAANARSTTAGAVRQDEQGERGG